MVRSDVLGGVLGRHPLLAVEVGLVAVLSLGAVVLAVQGLESLGDPSVTAGALLVAGSLLAVAMLGESVRDLYRLATVDGWPANTLLAVGAAVWRILEFLAVVAFVGIGAVALAIATDPPPGSESEGGGMLVMALVVYLFLEAALVVVVAVMVGVRAGLTVAQRGSGDEGSTAAEDGS
jgi:hypothetical protein